MPKKPTIANLYEKFWNKFIQVVRDHPLEHHPEHSIGFNEEDQAGASPGTIQITLKEPIYLGGWGTRDFPKSKCDIQIKVREHYMRSNPTVSTYTANELTFLSHSLTRSTADKKSLRFKSKVRFDYDPTQSIVEKPDHPLFHGHLVHEHEVTLPTAYEAKREILPHVDPRDHDGEIRLPTARMCFPSVLCFLVADHLGGEVLHELLVQTEDLRRELHAPEPCKAWEQGMCLDAQDVRRYHGIDWYHKSAPAVSIKVVKRK